MSGCNVTYGASVPSASAVTITLLASFWPVLDENGCHFTLQMHLHTVVAGPFWQLYRSVQAIPGLWPKGIIYGIIVSSMLLFSGMSACLKAPFRSSTNLTVSIHRQICIIVVSFLITVNYLTGGMPAVIQQFPNLLILGDPLIHDILNSINTVVAYMVVCFAVRTAQVTAKHVPCCI